VQWRRKPVFAHARLCNTLPVPSHAGMNIIRYRETNGSVRRLKQLGTFGAAVILLTALAEVSAHATVTVAPAEMTLKTDWVQKNFLKHSKAPPFSFTCGGKSSVALLRAWRRVDVRRALDANRTKRVITWTDAASGLVVKCVAVEYSHYPVVEWTVFFKNTGTKDTPILENIQGLDMILQRNGAGEFVLNGIKGDFCAAESFQPYQVTLSTNFAKKCAPPPISGKSCDGPDGWPYYNLQMPGGGIIVAVGWPGQWASSFTRDASRGLQLQAGQQLTHLLLRPGEEIRTPLIALLFWRGTDTVRAQNLWRRWYIAHTLPRVDGQTQGPLKQIQVNGDDPDYVKTFLETGIIPDICWRDAGAGGTTWYPSDDGPYTGADAWLNTGTWEVDATKFPKGFTPFSDWLRARQMKFVLWFEPERVGSPVSWLGRNRSEWLLPATDTTVGAILNEGHPDALRWLINHVDGLIKSQGIDWYREDMNGNGPLPAWRNHDPADRQGITENFYVQGHLAFWDELKRRNPALSIDSCASGGRRNDLETMRRAVPLLRSDFQFPDTQKGVNEGNQGHTYGLSAWLPFQGSGVYGYDPYSFRSFYMASFGMGRLTPENRGAQKQAYAECSKIAPAMLSGDYYPLTPYSLADDAWIAWQFDRPEAGEGCVQAFRRVNNPTSSMKLKLQGLNPAKTYEVEDFDQAEKSSFSGKVLMQTGLTVRLEAHAAAVFHYKLLAPDVGK
jgi:alpha-galactosidase